MLARLIGTLIVLLALAVPARAIDIREVTSPGGLTAWLVHDKTVPLVHLRFSFRAGAADPAGQEGAANFLTGMLDEGAGDLDSAAFQARRDELAFRLSFDASLDHFSGSFATLSRNLDESSELLRLALTAPRFDAEPLERVRQQFLLSARDDAEDPDRIAARAFMEMAFGGDPYARPVSGTEETVKAIAAADLAAAHRLIFTQATLRIAVVGDIDAARLAPLLDRVFGGLAAGENASPPSPAKVAAGPSLKIIDRDIPQSIVVFGHEGILRDDPDFVPAFVMSEILGGGGFGSRLTEELREKRGLTYGVGADFLPLRRAGLFLGQLSTRNEKAGEAVEQVKEVLNRMAEEGPAPGELADAKTYLTGSYALRFDSGAKIAGQLLAIQQQGLGIDYVERRNSLVERVTIDDVKAQARRLLHAERLIIAVVGRPEGIH